MNYRNSLLPAPKSNHKTATPSGSLPPLLYIRIDGGSVWSNFNHCRSEQNLSISQGPIDSSICDETVSLPRGRCRNRDRDHATYIDSWDAGSVKSTDESDEQRIWSCPTDTERSCHIRGIWLRSQCIQLGNAVNGRAALVDGHDSMKVEANVNMALGEIPVPAMFAEATSPRLCL